jgi:glucose/arabinose dehydrogenase
MTGEGVEVSRLTFGYPPSAPNLSLATRSVAEGVELAFVLQANVNDPNLPDIPVQMSGAQTGSLPSGSMYRVVVGQSGSIGFPERLASGIRNAGGVVYDTAGNIWFTDNGHGDSNGVPISRDELNVIPATQVGGEPELFGYPGSYSAQQGGVVGGLGYQPMASFDDAVGASEVIRTPGSFPHQGMLIGFHGKSTVTGVNNLWNPVLLVNIQDGSSMPFILPGQDGSGNLDSFAVVGDALYVAELSEGRYTGDGAIYKITAIPEPRSFVFIPIFLLLVALMAKRRKI